jgi:hypothetical protein
MNSPIPAASNAAADNIYFKQFLTKLPEAVQQSFSSEQLSALQLAFGAEPWTKHPIDFRDSFKLWRWRFYFVFVAGRDLRQLAARRFRLMRRVKIIFLALYLVSSTLLAMFALYLLKSALGIDIFPHFSFGIWGWFQQMACHK